MTKKRIMSYWNGKIAWVTGASSGIGKAICEGLADAGAIVVLSSRNQNQLEEVQKELKNSEKHFVLPLDLEKSETFESKVNEVIQKYGRIDYLFDHIFESLR